MQVTARSCTRGDNVSVIVVSSQQQLRMRLTAVQKSILSRAQHAIRHCTSKPRRIIMMIFIIQFMLLQFLAVQSAFQGETSLSVGSQNATALEQGLMHGNAAGAVLLVQQNVAPAVASGMQHINMLNKHQ